MLTTLKKILHKAQREHYAVGAFNVNNLEILQGILSAAISLRSPIILQTSEGAIQYAGLDYLFAILNIAAKSPIPVVIHLDHGKNIKLIREAIKKGYSSVMFDGSALPFEENAAYTKEIVRFAHKNGVSVEAELGILKNDDNKFTDPKKAEEFVKSTQCDALAIAIGTSHGAYKFEGEPKLDFERLHEIHQHIKIPLVLHGASGVPHYIVSYAKKHCKKLHSCAVRDGFRGVSNALIRNAIRLGICKINIDTDLRIAFTGGVFNTLLEKKNIIDPREYLGNGKDMVATIVQEKIRLFGSVGKA